MKLDVNPVRFFFLVLYIVMNIIAGIIMIFTGEHIGDSRGRIFESIDVVVISTILVVGSYYILLSPVYKILDRIKVKQVYYGMIDNITGARIGYLLIILQFFFWLNSFINGTNIAGAGNIKAGSQALSYLFIILDPDFLFFIFYGIYRENKLFYPNLVLWLLSNLSRGWTGVFMYMLFFEACCLYRKKWFTVRKITMIALVVTLSYPVIQNIKWVIRSQAFTGVDYSTLWLKIHDQFSSKDYLECITDSFEHILGRLQVVSLLVEVTERAVNLQDDLDSLKIVPYWLEGLHGIIFDRIFYGTERVPVGVKLVEYIHPSSQFEGVGNTNISYPGWFYISPMSSHVYILYTMLLAFLSMYFVKKIKNSESSRDMIWLIWLMFLLPPWLGAMIKMIYSAVIFLILKILFSRPIGSTVSMRQLLYRQNASSVLTSPTIQG